ncbi:MAG: Ig-like domain-containing protein [Dysgonomonas sp.]|nr:Ig-like domain-containing protein [Dysgonomonas sp.]
MKQSLKKYTVLFFVFSSIALLIVSCANMASPSGGDYDFDPPKIVRTSPAMNATQVKKGKITLEFDENVVIKKPSENVIITPPQQSFPVIQTVNKRITVELRDSLIPNTTYTIDFTNSIVDNNEENPLENYSFSFSTGDVVDSLSISGKVLSADNLEPVKGMYVGLHSNLNDTAFTRTKFERISRTDETGGFTIRGVAPGTYKLYALDDTNRDYKYDNPAEAIAFMDALIEPSSEQASREDTIYVDTEKKVVDTVKTVAFTRFLPDNIILRSFKSDFQRQYLQKNERTGNKLNLYFGAPTQMPIMEPLNFEPDADWAILEKTAKNDTLTYWVKDQNVMQTDTLAFRITYIRTDTLNQSIPYTDTIRFVDRTRKKTEKEEKKKKDKKDEEKEEITFLDIKNNLSSSWDTHKSIFLEFSEPVTDPLSGKIKIEQMRDSVYHDISFQMEVDSLNPRKVTIKNKWGYGNEYRVSIDSAAIHSMYGLWNNKLEQKFKVKGEDEYGQLAILVGGLDSIPSFMELLDKSDKPIRKARVIDNIAVFKDLAPGSYYARIVLDANNNGVWDTGDYEKKIQPEMVCYSPKEFKIRAYSEHFEDEPWIIDPSTLANQKPMEITKQKPEEKEARRKKMEERDKNNQQGRNNNKDNNRDNRDGSQYNNRNNNNNYNNGYNQSSYNNSGY